MKKSGTDVLRNGAFRALFLTQFFGALNDNIFKNALVILIAYKGVTLWGFDEKSIVALAGGVFIAPFFFFSALAGQLADKMERSRIVRLTKWLEVVIMFIGAYGFLTSNFTLLMVSLFLMGLQSTFFGPTKYSIIPDLVAKPDLTTGNAYVEVGTFLAILIGTILGGVAAGLTSGELIITASILSVAVAGLIASYKVPKVPIADPALLVEKNPLPPTFRSISLLTHNKVVFNSALGISWFWFFGAGLLSILPILTKDLLFANENVVTLFLATFTIGIATGAIACDKLSFHRVEIGLVPWGSLGMTIFMLDLAWVASSWPGLDVSGLPLGVSDFLTKPGSLRIIFDLFMVSVFGGVFTVPLYTLLQERSEARVRSRIIAGNNILNALFMVISSLLLMGLYALEFTLPQIIVTYSILNLAVAVYIYFVVPEFTLRFLSWVLARLIYRVRTKGIENIPAEGPAVLVCNHVSFIDWLVLAAAIQRPIRFVMYYKFAAIPLARYLFRHARVIPIAGAQENKAIFDSAFDTVANELRAGELVCIFPEGGLTKDGEIQTFKRGIEHIISRNPVPVVPMALKGLWGSIFSHKDGGAFRRMPRRIWFHVDIFIGKPVPPDQVTAPQIERNVRDLHS